MRRFNLKLLKKEAEKEIHLAQDLKSLEGIFERYLGSEGRLSLILRSLKRLPKRARISRGKKANQLKKIIETQLKKKAELIKERERKALEEREWIDITFPGAKIELGHLHPLTQIKRKVEEIFQSMGFSIVEGPEIENEWYNFDALNIPKDHPARDLWDTLWIKESESQKSKLKSQKLLLRTHTSPVQVRYMEKQNPPLRIIVPGQVFRHEATDPSHEFQLLQVEGLMVDKKVSVAHLKAIIEEFLKRFFGEKIKIKLSPDYFPFTEPSFDISISCTVCQGRGCPTCKNTGYLEVAGAGMVHPQVFKNSGLNPKEWQGWAFGFGLDRLAMMKYKINDIRLLRSGDLRFLNQF